MSYFFEQLLHGDSQWVATTQTSCQTCTQEVSVESLLRLVREFPKPDKRVALLGVAAYAYLKKQFPIPAWAAPDPNLMSSYWQFAGIAVHVRASLPPYFCELVEPDDPRLKDDLWEPPLTSQREPT